VIRVAVGLLTAGYSAVGVFAATMSLLMYGWDWKGILVGLAYTVMLVAGAALLARQEWGRKVAIAALFGIAGFYCAQEVERQRRPRLYPAPPAQMALLFGAMGAVLFHRRVREDMSKRRIAAAEQ
jgi:hypothetical protein